MVPQKLWIGVSQYLKYRKWKNSLKCEPLHQALLQGCNNKSKFIHNQDLKPPIRRCYLRHSEPCCACEEYNLWFYSQCLLHSHSSLDFKACHFTVHLKETYMLLHRMFCPEKWKIWHEVHMTEPDIFSKNRHQECIINKGHLIPTQNNQFKWQADCCSSTPSRWWKSPGST